MGSSGLFCAPDIGFAVVAQRRVVPCRIAFVLPPPGCAVGPGAVGDPFLDRPFAGRIVASEAPI